MDGRGRVLWGVMLLYVELVIVIMIMMVRCRNQEWTTSQYQLDRTCSINH